ncbi:hypothetical protein M434DRAFT_401923, partial [Hypoxylon sp. CO27-5]
MLFFFFFCFFFYFVFLLGRASCTPQDIPIQLSSSRREHVTTEDATSMDAGNPLWSIGGAGERD